MNEADRALILEHRAWAERIGRRLARKHSSLEPDDFASAAMIGLIEAASRYRPGAGADFKAFAHPRVAGAVLDYHRTLDLLGRWERARKKAGVETKWSRRDGASPQRSPRDVSDPDVFGAPLSPAAVQALSRAADQDHRAFTREVLSLVRELPPPFGDVLVRHYLRGERMRDIGASLGLTESRVCQIAKEGADLLRAIIEIGTGA